MFGSERNELRNIFFTAWKKYQEKLPLEPIESQLLEIILMHPEYHAILNNPEKYQDQDFTAANPFLHMSLHLALREQIGTNRPAGIRGIYQTLCEKFSDLLIVEHQMMECLEKILWEAQANNRMPDEEAYLQCLNQIKLN